MTTVVTGANGHLGGNLVRLLLDRGESVRAIVHRNRDALDGLDAEFVSASLSDKPSLRAAFEGADTVVHAAAKISIQGDPDGSVRATNVDGTRHAGEAALDAGVARFVHVSSVHSFDLRANGPITEASPRSGPRNAAYDHSKYLGEQEIQALIREGLPATIVNPTGVIGPRDFAPSRMGQVFQELRSGSMPALVNGGFDFVDVRDVSKGIIAAAERGRVGENYLLGGHYLRIKELAHIASSVTGVKPPAVTLPIALAALGVPFAARAARRTKSEPKFTRESLDALRHGSIVDASKARDELGHNPRSTAETIRDVYDSFDGKTVGLQ